MFFERHDFILIMGHRFYTSPDKYTNIAQQEAHETDAMNKLPNSKDGIGQIPESGPGRSVRVAGRFDSGRWNFIPRKPAQTRIPISNYVLTT